MFTRLALCAVAVCAIASAGVSRAAVHRSYSSNDTVHIIFSNHLDVGYGGIPPEFGLDDVIINKYFQWYYPLAIRLGKWFDAHPGEESHIYHAHAYIVSLYLNCPPGLGVRCPSAEEKAEFIDACQRGHITWTALPYNGQSEVMDPLTLGSATHVTFYLDADVGVSKKTVVSQRDVPGLTRAAIPVLVNEGIRAISVGVNSGSAPPGVPHNAPFVWKDATSGAKVLAFWHPGGYGGHVPDSWGPGGYSQLTPAADCVHTPTNEAGERHILCFSWRGDNSGPLQDPDLVVHTFDLARKQFPGAKVMASTFEKFVDELEPFTDELEEVTAEIGDTWIYGIASDAAKSKEFKAIQRMRSKCLLEESCTAQDPAFRNFTRFLLKVPEHTWGLDTKAAPNDWSNWTNAYLHEQLPNANYKMAEHSWYRQYSYIQWAMEALVKSSHQPGLADDFKAKLLARDAPHPVEAAADAGTLQPLQLAGCTRHSPQPSTATPLPLPIAEPRRDAPSEEARVLLEPLMLRGGPTEGALAGGPLHGEAALTREVAVTLCDDDQLVLDTRDWKIRVDPDTGAISTFIRKWADSEGAEVLGTDWAVGGTFGQFLYSTYDEAFIRDWACLYQGCQGFDNGWRWDFGKPGADSAGVPRQDAHPRLTEAYKETGPSYGEEVLMLRFNFDADLVENAGAPANVTLIIRTWAGTQTVMLDAIWKDKTATRLPEALWMRFSPSEDTFEGDSMRMWKVGSLMSPLETVRNGSHSMHAVGDGGVTVQSKTNTWEVLQVVSLDAPLMAIGEPSPLPDIRGPPDVQKGFSYCLTNNVWGTNYIMWYPYQGVGLHMKFRFMITVRDSRLEAKPHWHLSFDSHFADLPEEMLL